MKSFNLKEALDGKPVSFGGHSVNCLTLDLRCKKLWVGTDMHRPFSTPVDLEKMELEYVPHGLEMDEPFIMVNGIKVPAPETVPLNLGSVYYIPDYKYTCYTYRSTWGYDPQADTQLLNLGLIHRSNEAAVIHAKALLGISQ